VDISVLKCLREEALKAFFGPLGHLLEVLCADDVVLTPLQVRDQSNPSFPCRSRPDEGAPIPGVEIAGGNPDRPEKLIPVGRDGGDDHLPDKLGTQLLPQVV
jgi:hypothetical protein